MRKHSHIMVIAGEASGDAHAGRMLSALKSLNPEAKLTGIGGDNMRHAGAEIFTDFSELAVMGLIEVIKRYPQIKKIFNQVVDRLKKERPDLLVLVDYPGFNLKLAKKAYQLGIPVVYYISPKVWAWKAGRVKLIKKYVTRMLVLFPFEEQLYIDAGVSVNCVGHPLVDSVQSTLSISEAKAKQGFAANKRVIGLFPGSRRSEISMLLPIMLDAAKSIRKQYDNIEFVVPKAPGVDGNYLQSFCTDSSIAVKFTDDHFYDVIRSCDAIVAASGTVTLEIALMAVPHFLVYRVSPISYNILSRLVKIPYVGLCNIVSQQNIVLELLQDEVTVEVVSEQLINLISNESCLQKAEKIRVIVKQALGPSGGAENAAQRVLNVLDESR